MSRKIRLSVIALLALAALEFGLLGAGAAGLVGGDGRQAAPSAAGLKPRATPTPGSQASRSASIELDQPSPAAIRCDGSEASSLRVSVRDSDGRTVKDGTLVRFAVYNGSASPPSATTSRGSASTSVVVYSGLYSLQPNVLVNTGELEAAIRVRCMPDSGCPLSPPPNASPPCATPTSYPCIPSPGSGPMSPPCPPLSPPPCKPNAPSTPPCATPTPTPYPCNPSPGSSPISPPCPPLSPPPCDPNAPPISPPCIAPTPTPCSPSPPAVSPPCSALTMSIDADPTNGTRPCDPIDPAATVPPNTSHAIAVCLSHYLASFGSPPAFEARVGYSTLETAPEVADVAPALDDNPDANDGAGPNGIGASGWDCTAFGTAFPKGEEPFSPERDAFIFCSTSVVKGALTAEPGLLATVTLQSGAVGGIETLSVLGDSNIYGKNCEPIDALVCTGATITIDPGAPPLLSH